MRVVGLFCCCWALVASEAAFPRGDAANSGRVAGELRPPLERVWQVAIGAQVEDGLLADGERLFVAAVDGSLRCLASADGSERWRVQVDEAISAPPVRWGELLIVGDESGACVAYEAASGAERWRFATEGEIKSAVAVVPQGEGALVLLGSYDHRVYALDAASGAERWRVETGNFVNGCPAVIGDTVVISGCDGIVRFIDLASGEQQATAESEGHAIAGAAVNDALAVVGLHEGRALAVGHDGVIRWEAEVGAAIACSPALGDHSVFLAGRDRRIRALALADGSERWQFRTRGKNDSAPLLLGGLLVAGSDDGRLYLLDATRGEERWHYDCGAGIMASPVWTGSLLVIATRRGEVMAFAAERP